jgi:hypothetical protein
MENTPQLKCARRLRGSKSHCKAERLGAAATRLRAATRCLQQMERDARLSAALTCSLCKFPSRAEPVKWSNLRSGSSEPSTVTSESMKTTRSYSVNPHARNLVWPPRNRVLVCIQDGGFTISTAHTRHPAPASPHHQSFQIATPIGGFQP